MRKAAVPGSHAVPDYRQLMQLLPVAIYTCDAEGRVTQFNDAAVELWGRTPQIGKDMWCGSVRIYRADGTELPLDQCPMATALREGRAVVGEEIIIERPDGVRRRVEPHPQPLFDESGVLIGAVNVLIDATPRRVTEAALAAANEHLKRQAAALRDSERRFAMFMEHLPGAAWIKDAAGRYVYANPEAGRIFPMTGEAIRGKTDADVFPPETAAQFVENDRRALATGRTVQTIERLKHADGVEHHSIVSKFPLPGPDGRPAFVAGVAIDITDQVRAEQEARNAEARFHALALNVPAAMFVKDLEGRYTLANRLAAEALGRPEGVDGLSDHDLLPKELADALRRQDLKVIADAAALESEELVGAPGGEVRTFLSVKFPMTDTTGKTCGVGGVAIDVTDRDRAIALQREAAALLEGSIDALTSHIAILDQHGTIIKVNEAWRRFASENGYKREGLGVGLNYLDACPPSPAPHAGDVWGSAVEAGQAIEGIRSVLTGRQAMFEMEYACHAPDKRRWFTMRVTRFGEGDGTRVVVAHDDVTARYEAERLILQGADRLRLATAAASLGTWQLDPATGRISWDERCRELLGCGGDQADLEAIIGAVHPEDRERVREEMARALSPAGGGKYETEYRSVGIDDRVERWLRANGQATFENGRPVLLIGTLKDITAPKKAEEALRRNEEMMRLATDASEVGTWARDLIMHTVRWSPKLEEIFGLPHGGFPGREGDFFALVHPDDRERVSRVVETAIAERSEYEVEFRYRHASGEHRWMVGRGRAWYDAGGKPVLLAGTGQDITARKEAERALEDAVRARTAELQESNERLRLAERMAALGTLSAGLGHDMGNLLVPIRIRLASLASGALPPEYSEDVEAIRSSVEYLQRLANGLRMLSIDPGRMTGAESTDLAKWWADAHPLLKNILPRGVKLESNIAETAGAIAMSRAALTQAVFNLVQNAGDALRSRGSGTVTVTAAPAVGAADGTWVMLRVADDGPGMTPEVKRRCMEPFFTTKTRDISTGLGLLLVYGLVREAGGSVDLESELGSGTVFTIRLRGVADAARRPAASGGTPETAASAPASVPHPIPKRTARPMTAGPEGLRILCVDDNKEIAHTLRMKFSGAGFHWCGWLPDAGDVVNTATREAASIVLLDIDMPGKSPFEAVGELRQRSPDTRVIVFSGHVRRDLIDRALDAGAWGYVSKNDGEEALLEAVRQVAMGEVALSAEARTLSNLS